MGSDLKKELEASIATAGPSYVDSPARRAKGKVFFRNREVHDFSCLDVLGLSQNPKVKRAGQETIEALGISQCSSRKAVGTSDTHLSCEKALADFFTQERALLFSGRNQAVLSLLATLLREQDQVFCDEDYAGLLSDVCLLLNCPLEIVALDNLQKLEEILEDPIPFRRRFIFADAIGASSGRKLDMHALALLSQRQNSYLIVDESSAAGILGARGAGVSEECYVGSSPARPFCVISDLGFGLGCFGACLSGPKLLIDALTARSKTLGAEPSLPPHLAAGIRAAVGVCELSFAERTLTQAKVEYIHSSLSKTKQRLNVVPSSFVSVHFDRWNKAKMFSEHLFAKGFFVEVLSSPSRFSESALVRIIPSYFHTEQTIQELVNVIDSYLAMDR